MQQFHAAMRAIAFRHVLNGCDKCFGGFDKHFGGFDKHSGGFDKHFVRFDEHLARIFDVLTSISAPPNHTPAPCCVECQNIENPMSQDVTFFTF